MLGAEYCDKRLGGVNAVQTLSRLNRTRPDKENVFVLDFVNETEDIKEAFQPYYTTTVLSESTDPNILYDLERDILNYKLFDEREAMAFAEMWHRNVSPSELNAFIDALMERWEDLEDDDKDEAKSKISDFLRKYSFIAQIITFQDRGLEAMNVFLWHYRKKIPVTAEPLPTELLDLVNLESIKVPKA